MSSAREQLIETTCNLLELQGYHATGLNQIIKESGTPRGSLYYYFPGGKEELAVAAVNHAGAGVLARIRVNLAAIDEPVAAIHAFIRQIAHAVERSGFRAGGPITTIAMESAATNEQLRAACHAIYAAWQDEFVAKLLEGGMGNQRARRLAALIISTIEGGIILCRTGKSRQPLEDAADELAQLLTLAFQQSTNEKDTQI